MKEVSPQAIWIAMVLIIAASSILTLLGSILTIVLYRRGVLRTMNEKGFEKADTAATLRAETMSGTLESEAPQVAGAEAARDDAPRSVDADALYRRAAGAPWQAALHTATAGLAFALVLAAAYCLAVPAARTLPRFALTLWVDAWPIVLATALTAPRFARWAGVAGAAYFAPFALGTLFVALTAPPAPASLDEGIAAMRDSVTPPMMLMSWLFYGGIPTALLLLFLNRWTRAVSPLLLAFTTVVSSACLIAWFSIYTDPAKDFVIDSAVATGLSVYWLLLGALVLVILISGACGWLLLGRVRSAYLAKTLSDRSLELDAVWLVFAVYFAMQFALQGIAWLSIGVLAFAAYKLTPGALSAHAGRSRTVTAPHGLTFLRVFSLGTRSNALLESIGKHWRSIGSIQLITGPDVAHSTVQPHQLLDFLSGRLAGHFIGDARSLEDRLKRQDRAADRDGWYRVNSFFCRADAWQAALAKLVGEGDAILMDLRSFSSRNAGCVHELRHLIHRIPLERCVFVVDESTDAIYLRRFITEEWTTLQVDSPNRSAQPGMLPLLQFDAGSTALRSLLQRLCEASAFGTATSGRVASRHVLGRQLA